MKLKNLVTGFVFLFCAAAGTPAVAGGTGSTVTTPGTETFLWQAVLSGKVIAEPALLSYGFCVITDAKKIDCISYLGVKLWEKEVPFPRSSKVFALSDDFVIICQSGKISLLNPSGLTLWESVVDFECKGAVSLWDGRFLVFGESKIVCFGINGIKKWQINPGSQNCIQNDYNNLPQIDEEGYVYFKLSDSASLKLSPFGAGEVCDYDFSKEKNILSDKNELEEKLVKEKFPRQRISKAFLSPELDFILCKEDWNIELYNVLTREEKKSFSYFFQKQSKKNYQNFYNLNQIYSIITNHDEISDEIRLTKLKEGNYGENELVYASEALNVLHSYQEEINTEQFGGGVVYSDYEANAKDFEIVIKQIPLFASADFSKVSADYITHTKNFAVLKLILKSVASCGYDPDLQILSAIQNRTRNISLDRKSVV